MPKPADKTPFALKRMTTLEHPFGWRRTCEPFTVSRHPTLEAAQDALRAMIADLRRQGWSSRVEREDVAVLSSAFDHGSQASQFAQDVEDRLYID